MKTQTNHLTYTRKWQVHRERRKWERYRWAYWFCLIAFRWWCKLLESRCIERPSLRPRSPQNQELYLHISVSNPSIGIALLTAKWIPFLTDKKSPLNHICVHQLISVPVYTNQFTAAFDLLIKAMIRLSWSSLIDWNNYNSHHEAKSHQFCTETGCLASLHRIESNLSSSTELFCETP